MWNTIKSLFSFVSPVEALREQINLHKAQLAEAHSLVARQTTQIEKLQTENKDLSKQNEELKRSLQAVTSKPIQYPPNGIV